jgi:hypothetical protein
MRDADTILAIIREPTSVTRGSIAETCEGTGPGHGSLESRMRSKPHVRFGGGPTEKGRSDRHLAGGLPYLLTRSSTGIASAFTPPFN